MVGEDWIVKLHRWFDNGFIHLSKAIRAAMSF
jgi:hypothetical protein